MTTQTVVTLELPESLYRSATQVAQATKRPLADVLRESLVHGLPPLDDVPLEEADELARLSSLDDAALWQESFITMPTPVQTELNHLLTRQSEGTLSLHDENRLQRLMDEYSRLLVRKAHVWLLLARRGYRVPPQKGPG